MQEITTLDKVIIYTAGVCALDCILVPAMTMGMPEPQTLHQLVSACLEYEIPKRISGIIQAYEFAAMGAVTLYEALKISRDEKAEKEA